MMTLVTAHRLYVLLGVSLLGLGLFAFVHPEFARGGSLILLGLAALERGSGRARRLFLFVSNKLDDRPRVRARRRRPKPPRPGAVRPQPGWLPVT